MKGHESNKSNLLFSFRFLFEALLTCSSIKRSHLRIFDIFYWIGLFRLSHGIRASLSSSLMMLRLMGHETRISVTSFSPHDNGRPSWHA